MARKKYITPKDIYLEVPSKEYKYGYTLADWLEHMTSFVERTNFMVSDHQRDIYTLRGMVNILERQLAVNKSESLH